MLQSYLDSLYRKPTETEYYVQEIPECYLDTFNAQCQDYMRSPEMRCKRKATKMECVADTDGKVYVTWMCDHHTSL